jgi:hypothetical protein
MTPRPIREKVERFVNVTNANSTEIFRGEYMTTFIAIYRGETVAASKLVAVSADPVLVARIVSALRDETRGSTDDQVLNAMEIAKYDALELIEEELKEDGNGN